MSRSGRCPRRRPSLRKTARTAPLSSPFGGTAAIRWTWNLDRLEARNGDNGRVAYTIRRVAGAGPANAAAGIPRRPTTITGVRDCGLCDCDRFRRRRWWHRVR